MNKIKMPDRNLGALPSIRRFLDYEIRSSIWVGWIEIDWIQNLTAQYFAWKTKRKYARYVQSLDLHDFLLKMNNEQ